MSERGGWRIALVANRVETVGDTATDPQRRRLIDLIAYVEAVEKDKFSTVIDFSDHKGFRRDEPSLRDLPGVTLSRRLGDDDPVWLWVDRLSRKSPPAAAGAVLIPWLIVEDDPVTRPRLAEEALISRPAGESDGNGEASPGTVSLDAYAEAAQVREEFDAYLAGSWAVWSSTEAPRRATIKLYNELFGLRQALDGASEAPTELVWGIGMAALARDGLRMRYPLLTVQLEISLDERGQAIVLRPRVESPPSLETEVLDRLGLASVSEWRTFAEKSLAALDDEPLSPFAPETFEPMLRQAVRLLDPDARYLPDHGGGPDRAPPPATPQLLVNDGFVVFQRDRRATQLLDDLRRFRGLLESDETPTLFPAVVSLLAEPADELTREVYPVFRGLSTIPGATSADGSGEDLYFPMPFNREQVEVVQRLASRPGVVVQGPPGTGKTHTIANIICHALAKGERVLVTSQKGPALKVLREKLPQTVRPLAVSLIDSDRDGLRQFRESVDVITERLQRTRTDIVGREIADLEGRIDGLHRWLARVDREVEEIGRRAITPAVLDGADVEPVNAAREIVAAQSRADWLADAIDVTPTNDPQFTDVDITDVRQARKALAADLAYLDIVIPRPEDIADDDVIIGRHRDAGRSEVLLRRIQAGELPELAERGDQTVGILEDMLLGLMALRRRRSAIDSAGFEWTAEVSRQARLGLWDEAIVALEALRPAIDALAAEHTHFLTRPILIPDDAVEDSRLQEAIGKLAKGLPGLGLVARVLDGALKARLAGIRLVGASPRGADDWTEVARLIAARRSARSLCLSWNHAASQTVLATEAMPDLAAGRRLQRQLDHLAEIRGQVDLERSLDQGLAALLPSWRGSVAGSDAAVTEAITILQDHRLRLRLAVVQSFKRDFGALLANCRGDITDRYRALMVRSFGDPAVADGALRDEWATLRGRLHGIWAQRARLDTVSRAARLVEASGAPEWANALRRDPVLGVEDPWTPGDWAERWRLRRLSAWLGRIDRHDRLRALGGERRDAEDQLKQAYERAVEVRTWLALKEKATDSVLAALAAYAEAVRRIGRGTGQGAARHRREAREASHRAKGALPCWIMPHHRVSESLPAEFGLFDLVVIDEASQSTSAALPVLLRAKKVLIVGDDRQVSPESVGRLQARADLLAQRHLRGQAVAFQAALREEKSLYDLGKVVFAGGAIMLTEHFRCVAPIIEFSKAQFYNHQLQPLRLPTASERLDPPLVDILVTDGYRRGMTNPPEAECIVAEIERITADPAMASRTIGVTTLLGQEQAALIFERIVRTLGPELMDRHRIRVGDPTAFQGDERDIMFVSLVASPGSQALSGARFEQRFNVAASRAKDRMILVRSVEIESLSPSDVLRRALLDHFRAPFKADGPHVADRRARCQSDFERELFDLLAERGYRLDTQVPVGAFRIDIVVEGEDDRRLAIECDGDRWHGPDRWSDDMARQRVLERAGWKVWRCFASRFVRRREAVLAELIDLLGRLGIRPIGLGEGWISRHSEFRRWSSTSGEEPMDSHPSPAPSPDAAPEMASSSDGDAIESAIDVHDDLVAHDETAEMDIVDRMLAGRPRLSAAQTRDLLEAYRRMVIERAYPGAEPRRCLLRPEIIDKLIEHGCDDRDGFVRAVPEFMRSRIDPRQMTYLDDVIEIVLHLDRHGSRA